MMIYLQFHGMRNELEIAGTYREGVSPGPQSKQFGKNNRSTMATSKIRKKLNNLTFTLLHYYLRKVDYLMQFIKSVLVPL